MRMKIAAVAIAVLALAVLPAARVRTTLSEGQNLLPNNHEVKHVIIMVADGMGLADVTAARIRMNGITGASLRFETLDEIGYQRTYSEKNTVTDSAAAASAWACGEKFVNDEICLHGDGRPNNANLLDLARAAGWATGLVSTQTITNATPAAFGAHIANRDCETEIARQYVQVTRPDAILGGGRNAFIKPAPGDPCGAFGNFVTEATATGYTYVTNRAEMQAAVVGGASRLLGLFRGSYMTPEILRSPASTEPHLSEMAGAALNTLDRLNDRFFVLIEGGLIDLANHVEWVDAQVREVSAFDDAVGVALDWINASEERKQHTLLIVLADHETGGFAVMGTEVAGSEPLGTFYPGWTFLMPPPSQPSTTVVAGHTGSDTMIWSQGPGSAALGRAIDNTTLYEIVKAVLR